MALNSSQGVPRSFGSSHEVMFDMDKNQPFSWVFDIFLQFLDKDSNMAAAVSAVGTMTEVIRVSKAKTMMELEKELNSASNILKDFCDSLSVASGCDLFTRFVIRTSADYRDFEECKRKLIEKGQLYLKQSEQGRNKIAQLASGFIRDGMTVLTHGYSQVVMGVFMRAVSEGKRFNVIVTESRPLDIGFQTAKKLQEMNIPVSLVSDSAVAAIMDQVDLVLVGAEGIVENGGIINKVGTYQVSIIAKACSKPFYVAAESFKFMRLYPLNQKDIAKITERRPTLSHSVDDEDDQSSNRIRVQNPSQDYTSPSYITLLFTELGVLTPAAVSDELINLYNDNIYY